MILYQPSPNHEPRPDGTPIDMLILHYTGMETGPAALDRLCDPAAKVSAHYMIEEDGTIYSLVPEERRAWHAGVSFWRGNTDINSRSIGIELVNPGHEFGYRPFPRPQMDALIPLVQGILSHHPIPPRNVVAHSDVAPTRKDDPGELFDWRELALEGIGLWPVAGADSADPSVPPLNDSLSLLSWIGYDVTDPQAALVAFQRHFRQSDIGGNADEETIGLIRALAARL